MCYSIADSYRLWTAKLYSTFVEKGYYKYIFQGLGNTIRITIGALAIGVFIGFAIAVLKYFIDGQKKRTVAGCIGTFVIDFYVTVVRGIPVVVLLLIFYLVIFPSSGGISVAILTFGINSGAYMAELVRSGLNSVDPGQAEAGYSLGLNRSQTMMRIIAPQALRNILPGIGNEFIALLKETSVAGYVAVVDLTRAGTMIRNNTYDAFNPLMLVALVYLAMVVLLTHLLSRLERKMKHERD